MTLRLRRSELALPASVRIFEAVIGRARLTGRF